MQWILLFTIQINDVWGELTDISAKTKTLSMSNERREKMLEQRSSRHVTTNAVTTVLEAYHAKNSHPARVRFKLNTNMFVELDQPATMVQHHAVESEIVAVKTHLDVDGAQGSVALISGTRFSRLVHLMSPELEAWCDTLCAYTLITQKYLHVGNLVQHLQHSSETVIVSPHRHNAFV